VAKATLQSREVYSGSSLLADLNFQSVSGLYKNFSTMSPSEFEIIFNFIGEKISKKDTAFKKAISVQENLALMLRFDKFHDTFLSPLHFTTTRKAQETAQHYRFAPLFKTEAPGMERRAEEQMVVTLHVHTCSGRNRIIPLMRRSNTKSTPNKPATLRRKPTFDTLRGHESRPHCHDTALRYAVTLQVCTHLYTYTACLVKVC
jgi:hypothetical protein